MAGADYGKMFPHRWMWPIVSLGIGMLATIARAARWHYANVDARNGSHVNHTICRNGRAVNW